MGNREHPLPDFLHEVLYIILYFTLEESIYNTS